MSDSFPQFQRTFENFANQQAAKIEAVRAVLQNPICRLARAVLVRGNAAKPSRHSESSGTDAGRQCVFARDARIWGTWNYAALGRGNTPGNVMGALIKERLRCASMVCSQRDANTEPSR
jgi:hypothetical protein